jgi:hypothetical protein
MKRICWFLLFITFIQVKAQLNINSSFTELEMTGSTPLQTALRGGKFITSLTPNGQYLRVLLVFIQFKDDNYLPTNSDWPLNQAPVNWMGTNIIDQNISQSSTNQNLTHYFNVMSMGKFKMIGDCYNIITPYTRQEYINMNYTRKDINKQILKILDTCATNNVNYSLYDNWTPNGEYNHTWGPDNKIDMIFTIYRNIADDLTFIDDYTKTQWLRTFGFGFSGEASLGTSAEYLWVANGTKKIIFSDCGTNWNTVEPFGSGITCTTGLTNGLSQLKSVIIHEFGHHLFECDVWYDHVSSMWGIMNIYGGRSCMVNAWERYKLNWIDLIEFDPNNPNQSITLSDYITTGEAVKIRVPGSSPERYYLLENHQRVSPFDNIDNSVSDGKGIYTIYQSGVFDANLKLYSAKGRSDWTYVSLTTHPLSGTEYPLFSKTIKTRNSGSFDSEMHSGGGYFCPIELYRLPLISGNYIYYNPIWLGDGKDALTPGVIDVFSPWSNPKLDNVAFQVFTENNLLKVRRFIQPIDAPPSQVLHVSVTGDNLEHPQISWLLNEETDISTYQIYRNYDNGDWILAGSVSASTNSFLDVSVTFTKQAWEKTIKYYVIAVDNTSKSSVQSDIVQIEGIKGPDPSVVNIDGKTKTQLSESIPADYSMKNYPNPFNPATTIIYNIKESGFVSLKIYNMLGQEIAVLVNQEQNAGVHQVTFNANNLTSGIYLYELRTGSIVLQKKMNFIK